MNICVIGMGNVGLVTAAVLADMGNDVVGADADPDRVARLAAGECPIFEPDLPEYLRRNLAAGRLRFTTDITATVGPSQIVFIAVGTPSGADGPADLGQVREAAVTIARGLRGHTLIVVKSTVPVGTGHLVAEIVREHAPAGATFEVCANPEFLREGSAIEDALAPDRIVIGAAQRQAADRLIDLYLPLNRPVIVTDLITAEMIKHASNAFLATKISFINAIADICELVGAEVGMVAAGMAADRRIGPDCLQPGLGYGGSCLPKDAESLVATAAALGHDFTLLRAAQAINRERVGRMIERMIEALGPLQGQTVGVLGLAFKGNTDDIRESRGVELIRALLERGAGVRAYDPAAMPNCAAVLPEVHYAADAYDAARGCHALVIAADWDEFRALDLRRLKEVMAEPALFDGRAVLAPDRVRAAGLRYFALGVPARP